MVAPFKWSHQTRGIARDMYAQGVGNYAFVDGHVRFMKMTQTVGAIAGVPPEQYRSEDNPHNLWIPDR